MAKSSGVVVEKRANNRENLILFIVFEDMYSSSCNIIAKL